MLSNVDHIWQNTKTVVVERMNSKKIQHIACSRANSRYIHVDFSKRIADVLKESTEATGTGDAELGIGKVFFLSSLGKGKRLYRYLWLSEAQKGCSIHLNFFL